MRGSEGLGPASPLRQMMLQCSKKSRNSFGRASVGGQGFGYRQRLFPIGIRLRCLGAKELSMSRKTQIVVVGGGAGGLELVRRLGAKYGRKAHDIIPCRPETSATFWKPLLHGKSRPDRSMRISMKSATADIVIAGAIASFRAASTASTAEAKTISLAPVHDEDGRELIGQHTIRYDILVLAVGVDLE